MDMNQDSTHRNDQDVLTQVLEASVEAKPTYPVKFHFRDGNRTEDVALSFPYPIEAPRRDETISLSFVDQFGKKRRVSGSVEYAVHSFFGPGTVNIPGFQAGYILNIRLTGITEQSPVAP